MPFLAAVLHQRVKQGSRLVAHGPHILAHGGQGGHGQLADVQPVKAHDGDILRDAQPRFPHGPHGPQGHQVAEAEHGLGTSGAAAQALGHLLIGHFLAEVAVQPVALPRHQPCRLEGFQDPLHTHHVHVGVLLAAHDEQVPQPLLQQEFHCLPGRLAVINGYPARVLVGDGHVHRHGGDAGIHQLAKVGVVGGDPRKDGARDTVLGTELGIAAFSLLLGVRGIQGNLQPVLGGVAEHPLQQQVDQVVLLVAFQQPRNDQPDVGRLLGGEIPGADVGRIAQLTCRQEDPFLGFRADILVIVEGAGYCTDGHTGPLGYVLD